MRENDSPLDPEVKQAKMIRGGLTLGGFLVWASATVFAFIHPDKMKEAFGVALIGTGIIDPWTVVNFFRRDK